MVPESIPSAAPRNGYEIEPERAGPNPAHFRAAEKRPLSACRHHQLGADMNRYLGRVVINEVPDPVMRDATEFSPLPQRPDRRLLACRK